MRDLVALEMQVPEEWMTEIKDQATFLEILGLGLEEYRVRRALALYQQGAGSLGFVADLVGIPERVLMEDARKRGVLPHYDEHHADEDVRR